MKNSKIDLNYLNIYISQSIVTSSPLKVHMGRALPSTIPFLPYCLMFAAEITYLIYQMKPLGLSDHGINNPRISSLLKPIDSNCQYTLVCSSSHSSDHLIKELINSPIDLLNCWTKRLRRWVWLVPAKEWETSILQPLKVKVIAGCSLLSVKGGDEECVCVGSITIPRWLPFHWRRLLSHSPNQLPSVKTAHTPLIPTHSAGFKFNGFLLRYTAAENDASSVCFWNWDKKSHRLMASCRKMFKRKKRWWHKT